MVRQSRAGQARSSLFSVAVANAALPLTALAVSPMLARSLGSEGRGLFANVIVPISFAPNLLNLGQQEAAVYLLCQRGLPRRSVATAGALLTSVTGLLGMLLVWQLVAPLTGETPQTRHLLTICSIYVPIVLVFQVLRAQVISRGGFRRLGAERWLQALTRLVGMCLLFTTHRLTLTSAVFVHLASVVLGALVLLGSRSHDEAPDEAPARVRQTLEAMLHFGLRSWVGGIGVLLLLRLDQVILGPLAGATQLGLYAVAVSVAEVPMAAVSAFRLVLIPQLNPATAAARLKKIGQQLTAISLVVAGPLIVASYLAFPIVYGPAFNSARPMAVLLLIACLPLALTEVANVGLVALGRPGLQLTSSVAGVAVVAVLLPLLGRSYGGLGAALTAVAAYSVAAVTAIAAVQRVTGEALWTGLEWLDPRPSVRQFIRPRLARPRAAEHLELLSASLPTKPSTSNSAGPAGDSALHYG